MIEQDNKKTREKLLRAGTDEFLQYGFKGASLRRICKGAGVTTGAVYFFFENKEDLFCRIVEIPLEKFRGLYERSVQAEFNDPKTAFVNEDELIRFLMRYRKECILLLDKSEGTRYADFRKQYQQGLEATFQRFFDQYAGKKVDPQLVHLIATMRLNGYLELIYGNHKLKDARRLAGDMAYYADVGFEALIAKLKEEM